MLFRELTSKYQFSRRFIYRSGRHENLLPGRGEPVALTIGIALKPPTVMSFHSVMASAQ